jgi:hypothetical protein
MIWTSNLVRPIWIDGEGPFFLPRSAQVAPPNPHGGDFTGARRTSVTVPHIVSRAVQHAEERKADLRKEVSPWLQAQTGPPAAHNNLVRETDDRRVIGHQPIDNLAQRGSFHARRDQPSLPDWIAKAWRRHTSGSPSAAVFYAPRQWRRVARGGVRVRSWDGWK